MVDSKSEEVRHIPLAYDYKQSEESARRLVKALRGSTVSSTSFKLFTDGITNTLIKAETRKSAEQPQHEVDQDAVLLRAYGPGTDVLIDREREISAHTQLAGRGLASPLLARFNNGLLYSYVPGEVCAAEDMRKPDVYRKVAAKMGQWHGALSLDTICELDKKSTTKIVDNTLSKDSTRPKPNLWTVIESWLEALPHETEKERQRQQKLHDEYAWLYKRLADTKGLAGRDFVFAHCDLLCGNIIIQRTVENGDKSSRADNDETETSKNGGHILDVSFIDYEYATAAPAAFDIANHLSEWGGLECEYSVLPTKSQRHEFLSYYVQSFFRHSGLDVAESERQTALEQLETSVDLFRGVPGFYWGTWALIQAQISNIDFDYAAYADTRLEEYYAWKAADTRQESASNDEPSLREQRWATA